MRWLEKINIKNRLDLEKIGADTAYQKLLHLGHNRNKGLLDALKGVVADATWGQVVKPRKTK